MVDPYAHLALAVIKQAVTDVQENTPKWGKAARVDIRHGGLDHWVDMVCVHRHTHRCLQERLQKLVEQP